MLSLVKRENKRNPLDYRYGSLFDAMFDDFDSMFKDVFPGNRGLGSRGSAMDVDIIDEDKRFVLSAALPGMGKDEISIMVEDGVLTISAEKKSEDEESKKNYYRKEIAYGKMERRFSLPDYVDSEKIEADYKNGVLEIFLPKTEKADSRREISIKSGK